MVPHRLYARDASALRIPWLESPFRESLIEQSDLGPAERELCRRYASRGYVVVESGIPHAVLDAIAAGLADRYHPNGAPGHSAADRIQDAWRIEEPALRSALLDVVNAPEILSRLRLLYGREPVPFQTLNFPRGTQQNTHSDTVHFHCVPARFMCGVWVALEDIHPDAGPLHYYPGSQRLPLFDMHDLGYAGSAREFSEGRGRNALMHEYERFVRALVAAEGLEPETFCARKGQALIWAANLLHGGDPIRDPARSRHSQVTHYYFADSIYYTPFHSDPAIGMYALRSVQNLRSMAREPQSYLGRPVRGMRGEGLSLCVPAAPAPAPAARWPLDTRAALRLLCWPRYDAPEDLERLGLLARVVAGRPKVCLCLRYDPERDALPEASALARVERSLAAAIPADRDLDVLLVNDVAREEQWGALHEEVTAVLDLCTTDPTRHRFLRAPRRPLLESPQDLERALAAFDRPADAPPPRGVAAPREAPSGVVGRDLAADTGLEIG